VAQHVRVQVLPQLALAGGLPVAESPGPRRRPCWLTNTASSAGLVMPAAAARAPALRAPFADRQQAGLAALAEHLNHAVGQVQLIEVQAGQLRQAQAEE
jgi:hypothetical protein